MPKLMELVEGWTKQLSFTLKIGGNPVNLDGYDVVLQLSGPDGLAFDYAGPTSVDEDQAGAGMGKVYYTPDAADLQASLSPLYVRWKVTGSDGVVYFPNTVEPDTIEIGRAPTV